ncbi:MAG: DMT family transporter [Chloroflexota bacterium]
MTNLEVSVSAQSGETVTPASSTANSITHRFTWMDLWMLLLMVIWGTNIVILKSALTVLPPFVLNGVRFTFATFALGIIFKWQGLPIALPRRDWLPVIGLAFLEQPVYQAVFLYALRLTTVANSALLGTTAPIWVVLFNAWRGHDRLRRRGSLGVLLAFLGVVVVIVSRDKVAIGGDTLSGDVLTLVGSAIFASAMLMSRGLLQRNTPSAIAFWITAWGAIFQVAFSLPELVRLNWSAVQPSLLIAVFYSGVVSIGIGTLIWSQAIKRLGTGRTAIYTYLEPVVASSAAIVVLHELFTPWLAIGAVMVLCGVLLVQRG